MTLFRPLRSTLIAALVLVGLSSGAGAQVTYDVELEQDLNGLPLKVETVPNDGVLVVKVTNTGTARARCDVRYDASPQPLARGYLYVDPGRTEQDAFRAKRRWSRVNVEVICRLKD